MFMINVVGSEKLMVQFPAQLRLFTTGIMLYVFFSYFDKNKTILLAFIGLIAIIVMISIRWIGILLINSLLILPAASSRNISKNMRTYHLFAIVFSMFSGILGLVLSYYYNIPTGPMIVIISGIIYFITFAIKGKVKE